MSKGRRGEGEYKGREGNYMVRRACARARGVQR
jgi:hypothetical protein